MTLATFAAAVSRAVYLCGPDDLFDTGTKRKKRARARRAHVRALAAASSGETNMTDLRADEIWDKALGAMRARAVPTGHRADKAARVKDYANGVRLDGELPAGIRQLLSKGMLTAAEARAIGRFREDYLLAYYSTPGMTSNYGAVGGGGTAGGVPAARVAVVDARRKIEDIRAVLGAGSWDVLVKMAVLDYAQLNVGGISARYKDVKARRYAAGVLLMDGAAALLKIYT